MANKVCGTCKAHPVRFFKECNICRSQWRAFYSGQTPVSPMMRAIEIEKQEQFRQVS